MGLPAPLVEFLRSTPAQVTIWLTVLAFLIVIGYYTVRRFRDRIDEDESEANKLISNFREMHHQGDITEQEFRTIKTKLGAKLHDPIKDPGNEV